MTKFSKCGFGLVEIIVGAAIITAILIGFDQALVLYTRSVVSSTSKIQASFLAEEGLETVRLWRDADWANITAKTVGTDYPLDAQYVDGIFSRQVRFDSVYRDGNGNIAAVGTLDSNFRLVTVSVAWLERGSTTTLPLSTYLAKLSN